MCLDFTTEKLYGVKFLDTHDHVISYPVISRNYRAVTSNHKKQIVGRVSKV